MDIRNHMIYSH